VGVPVLADVLAGTAESAARVVFQAVVCSPSIAHERTGTDWWRSTMHLSTNPQKRSACRKRHRGHPGSIAGEKHISKSSCTFEHGQRAVVLVVHKSSKMPSLSDVLVGRDGLGMATVTVAAESASAAGPEARRNSASPQIRLGRMPDGRLLSRLLTKLREIFNNRLNGHPPREMRKQSVRRSWCS